MEVEDVDEEDADIVVGMLGVRKQLVRGGQCMLDAPAPTPRTLIRSATEPTINFSKRSMAASTSTARLPQREAVPSKAVSTTSHHQAGGCSDGAGAALSELPGVRSRETSASMACLPQQHTTTLAGVLPHPPMTARIPGQHMPTRHASSPRLSALALARQAEQVAHPNVRQQPREAANGTTTDAGTDAGTDVATETGTEATNDACTHEDHDSEAPRAMEGSRDASSSACTLGLSESAPRAPSSLVTDHPSPPRPQCALPLVAATMPSSCTLVASTIANEATNCDGVHGGDKGSRADVHDHGMHEAAHVDAVAQGVVADAAEGADTLQVRRPTLSPPAVSMGGLSSDAAPAEAVALRDALKSHPHESQLKTRTAWHTRRADVAHAQSPASVTEAASLRVDASAESHAMTTPEPLAPPRRRIVQEPLLRPYVRSAGQLSLTLPPPRGFMVRTVSSDATRHPSTSTFHTMPTHCAPHAPTRATPIGLRPPKRYVYLAHSASRFDVSAHLSSVLGRVSVAPASGRVTGPVHRSTGVSSRDPPGLPDVPHVCAARER